jgi:hypothetical protein
MTSSQPVAELRSRPIALRGPLLFFLRAGAVFLVLLFAWRWIGPAYAALFRGGASLASSILLGDLVSFEAKPGNPNGDTLLVLDREGCSLYVNSFLDSWFVAYLPTAMFLSLTLALGRKASGLVRTTLWGLLGIHVYIAMRVVVVAVSAFSGSEHISGCQARHPVAMNESWARTWNVLERLLYQEPLVYMLIPSLIWGLVAVRALNWEGLAMRPAK